MLIVLATGLFPVCDRNGGKISGRLNIAKANIPVLIEQRTQKMLRDGTYNHTTPIWQNASLTEEAKNCHNAIKRPFAG
jgi:hypothetical protein